VATPAGPPGDVVQGGVGTLFDEHVASGDEVLFAVAAGVGPQGPYGAGLLWLPHLHPFPDVQSGRRPD
jgi:hypothetical protein